MSTETKTPLKYTFKPYDWLNAETQRPAFGIQVKLVGFNCRWMHCAKDGKPLLFDSEQERDEALKQLRKRKGQQ